MIEINNLSFSFGETLFFNNINVSFHKNKINVILGQNGTGKTTLLKLTANLLKTQQGSINICDMQAFYLPQKTSYISGITLYEYLSSIFFKQKFKWILSRNEKNQINWILDELEIYEKKDILTENLSGGELQKANIALGLLSGANLLLLDEPVSNLDLVNQIKVFNIIEKLKQLSVTTIIILHDLNLAARYGDFFAGIDKYRNIYSSDKENFFTPEILQKIYNISFSIVKNNGEINVQISK